MVCLRKGKIRSVTNSSFVFAVRCGWVRRVRAKRMREGSEERAEGGIWRKIWCVKGAVR